MKSLVVTCAIIVLFVALLSIEPNQSAIVKRDVMIDDQSAHQFLAKGDRLARKKRESETETTETETAETETAETETAETETAETGEKK